MHRGCAYALAGAASVSAIAGHATPATEVVAEIRVNGRSVGDARLQRVGAGLCAPSTDWRRWGLRDEALRPCVDGDSVLTRPRDDVTARFEEATQSLELTLDHVLLEPNRVGTVTERASLSPTLPGWFGHYDLQWERGRYGASEPWRTRADALLEGGFADGLGSVSSSAVVRRLDGTTQTIRLETGWQLDDPDSGRRLVVGDGIAPGGRVGRAVRFGGFAWGNDTSLDAELLTGPTRTLRGSAALPSTVDVLIDDRLIARHEVGAGPFEITAIPTVDGAGNVRARVRDALGREQWIDQPFYGSALLLAPGRTEYTVAAGALRERYLVESNDYGRAFLMGDVRHGLDGRTTWSGRLEAGPGFGVAGTGLVANVAERLVAHAAVAASQEDDRSGTALEFGLRRATSRWQVSFDRRLASQGFYRIGEPEPAYRARAQTRTFAGLSLGRQSIGLAWVDRRSIAQSQRLVTMSWTGRAGRDGLVTAYVTREIDQDGVGAGVYWVVPLGPRESATAGVDRAGGRGRATVGFQRAAEPAVAEGTSSALQGLGYRLDLDTAGDRALLRSEALASSHRTTIDVALGEATGVRAGVSGSVRHADGRLLAVRERSGSVALVEADGIPGARVYLENRPAAVTDRNGRAWVAGLRPYQTNRLAIDPADLPIDARVDRVDIEVRPAPRAVAQARFPVAREGGIYLRLQLPDNVPMPDGASVYRYGDAEPLAVGARAEVWVDAARPGESLQVHWRGGTCIVRVPDAARRSPTAPLDVVCLPFNAMADGVPPRAPREGGGESPRS